MSFFCGKFHLLIKIFSRFLAEHRSVALWKRKRFLGAKKVCCIREERRTGKLMKKISKYLLEKWYVYAFAIGCLVIKVSLDMLSPQITKRMIDDVIGKGQKEIFPMLLFGVFFIGVGRCVLDIFKNLLLTGWDRRSRWILEEGCLIISSRCPCGILTIQILEN